MMLPMNISQFFKMQSPITPAGAVAGWKYALGGAVAGGLSAIALFGGKSQDLSQKQAGIAETAATYQISPSREGVVNLYYPSAATVSQAQKAEQTSIQTDYLQWILIGGIALAALYIFTKRKK